MRPEWALDQRQHPSQKLLVDVRGGTQLRHLVVHEQASVNKLCQASIIEYEASNGLDRKNTLLEQAAGDAVVHGGVPGRQDAEEEPRGAPAIERLLLHMEVTRPARFSAPVLEGQGREVGGAVSRHHRRTCLAGLEASRVQPDKQGSCFLTSFHVLGPFGRGYCVAPPRDHAGLEDDRGVMPLCLSLCDPDTGGGSPPLHEARLELYERSRDRLRLSPALRPAPLDKGPPTGQQPTGPLAMAVGDAA